MAKFICTVCGFIHEGDEAPAKCPTCGALDSKFSEMGGKPKSEKLQKINDEDYEIIKVIESSSPKKTREWYMDKYDCSKEEARTAIQEIRKQYKIDYGAEKFTPTKEDILDKIDELQAEGKKKESEICEETVRWYIRKTGLIRSEAFDIVQKAGVKFSTSQKCENVFEHLTDGLGCMVTILFALTSTFALLFLFVI